jgi:hypothetical protein
MKFMFQGLGAADTTDRLTHHDVEIRVACHVDLTYNGKAQNSVVLGQPRKSQDVGNSPGVMHRDSWTVHALN